MAMAPQGLAEHEHGHTNGHRSEPNSSSHTDPGAAATSSIAATNSWGPYSGAGDFASNMAVILAALLTALALALALNAAVRFLLGRSRRARRGRAGSRDSDDAGISDPEKPAAEAPPPPPPPALVVYSAAGTELAGAGAAECAICLAEFADGNAVRVMPACRHGFHARCIERWLAGGRRSSCPTCRAPAAVAAGAAMTAQPEAEVAASSSS